MPETRFLHSQGGKSIPPEAYFSRLDLKSSQKGVSFMNTTSPHNGSPTRKPSLDISFLLFFKSVLFVAEHRQDASYRAPTIFPRELADVLSTWSSDFPILQSYFERHPSDGNNLSEDTIRDHLHRIDRMILDLKPFRTRAETSEETFLASIESSKSRLLLRRTAFLAGMALLDSYSDDLRRRLLT